MLKHKSSTIIFSLVDEDSVIKPYEMKDLSEPLEITLP